MLLSCEGYQQCDHFGHRGDSYCPSRYQNMAGFTLSFHPVICLSFLSGHPTCAGIFSFADAVQQLTIFSYVYIIVMFSVIIEC